eukprot:scaffold97363_cov27-Phaeocystis_antarctica.AAC.1
MRTPVGLLRPAKVLVRIAPVGIRRPARAKKPAGADPRTGKTFTSTPVLGVGPAAITPFAGSGVRTGASR